jgi:Na+/H+ antiporter NhaC
MSPQHEFRFSDARHYLPYVLLIVVFIVGVWIILTVGSNLDRGAQTRTTTAATSPITSLTESFNENFRNPVSILLMQIVVIIIMAGLFGRLFRRLGQPPVMGEMLAGLPSVLRCSASLSRT